MEQPIKIFNVSEIREKSIEDLTRRPLRVLLKERRLKERSNFNNITFQFGHKSANASAPRLKEIIAESNAQNASGGRNFMPEAETSELDRARGVHSISMMLSSADKAIVNSERFVLNKKANEKKNVNLTAQ